MPTLLTNIAKRIRQVYQKAEDFIEEEREFPVSQVFLNATLKRFVTDNVDLLKDLHADLHDDWLRLYATISIKGVYTVLSVDLKLIQMEMNKDIQLIVFEQISNTQVIEATFPKSWMKIAANCALFVYQKVLKKDPLGPILEKYNIIKVQDDLLHLSLNRWLGKNRSAMDALNKVHINHAELRETELMVLGNVNLAAVFSKLSNAKSDVMDDLEDDLDANRVTPIQQK
ncbi:hypothetical protein [Acinetobacter sp. ANC 4648]|uniref:hypothetical protein n=1 Tax=Acinetobacter sp. ANC 4648 TaxID=1977875 RepID=UPI000A345F13|nr:hypothetical protein [Acinetobacter sp. ANC 4648]OTG84793.1 hypothetical protein B9T27_00795 [Acinetobacter sp. ANC 4648]